MLSRHVESFRFWDVVAQWARERLEHENIVAQVIAKGVLREGLRVQSVDPRWLNLGSFELKGAPLVGYVAREGDLPIFLRATALAHLQAIVERAAVPQPELLAEEFITQQDFHAWVIRSHIRPPTFWFEVPAMLRANVSAPSSRPPATKCD